LTTVIFFDETCQDQALKKRSHYTSNNECLIIKKWDSGTTSFHAPKVSRREGGTKVNSGGGGAKVSSDMGDNGGGRRGGGGVDEVNANINEGNMTSGGDTEEDQLMQDQDDVAIEAQTEKTTKIAEITPPNKPTAEITQPKKKKPDGSPKKRAAKDDSDGNSLPRKSFKSSKKQIASHNEALKMWYNKLPNLHKSKFTALGFYNKGEVHYPVQIMDPYNIKDEGTIKNFLRSMKYH
jgi:hypothetical protein